MVIKVYANDGKEFKGSDYTSLVTELKAYESDQKLKREKAEEERKVKEVNKQALVKQIKQVSVELHSLLKQYEDQEGHSFTYYDKDFSNINLTRLMNGLVNGFLSF